MVSTAEVAVLRQSTDDLATLAIRDTGLYLGSITSLDPVGVRNALIETTPAIISPYMVASSEVSAAWYEQVRPGTGYGLARTGMSTDQVDRLVRYSVASLFDDVATDVLDRLAGGLQKMVAGESRRTVFDNVDREQQRGRVRVGYARAPRAGCCAFCALMASRGAVYNTEGAAGRVVGRGIEPRIQTDSLGRRSVRGGGVKARGGGVLGDQFHNFCRCVVIPVERGEDLPYDRDRYLGLYERSALAGGTKEILADMRSTSGLK